MALQNYQYDMIMRQYNRKQAKANRILSEHRTYAYSHYPRLRQIDEEIAAQSSSCLRRLLSGEAENTKDLRQRIEKLSRERLQILSDAGLPPNYLEPVHECERCQDTGYIGNDKCTCFKQAEISLLYAQSNLQEVLAHDTFSRFSLSYYSDTNMVTSAGQTERQMAQKALDASRHFVTSFGLQPMNLFFYGDTGVGKTFLSHCIAHELLERSFCVLYFSAYDLFEKLARYAFSKEEPSGSPEDILSCELLIIDDLGTELTNSFVASSLFTCINDRLIREKSTIISTNLDLETLSQTYSERTVSRIVGNYQMVKLAGKDIRLQKLFSRRQ